MLNLLNQFNTNYQIIITLIFIIAFIIVVAIMWPRKKLILTPELIPYSMHYMNVRAVLSNEDWKMLAKVCYQNSQYRCDICRVKGKVECHEIWKFNDRKRIQSLVGLTTLCPDCHRVKHIGLARKMGWFGDALDHMAKVNNISIRRAKKFVEYAEIEVKTRKDIYDLDLTYLNNFKSFLPRKYGKRENDNCVVIRSNW